MILTFTGTVEKILYERKDTCWSVICLKTDDRGVVKAAGVMPGLRLGMTAAVTGEMEDTRWGQSLKVNEFVEKELETADEMYEFLSSTFVKSIGPVFARRIVDAFGTDTMKILDFEPGRLREVRGIGPKRADAITEAWAKNQKIRPVMRWLQKHGVTAGLATKIYAAYGDNAVSCLDENPYRLSDDIGGVGFKRADAIAAALGISGAHPFRIRSGIHACLEAAAGEGCTCLPADELIRRASSQDYLDIAPGTVLSVLHEKDSGTVTDPSGMVFLPPYERAEKKIARDLGKLLAEGTVDAKLPDMAALEKETGVTFSEEQRRAIRIACCEKVSIITGGPGTGKTVTTNAIIREWEDQGLEVLLAAPTGRAAKRLSEVTGHEALTIHRLLEFSNGTFGRDETTPLDGNALIIDEASMIDTMLMRALTSALPAGMRVVVVGDVDQLPSVGAGCVLRDLIDSGRITTTRLTEIYRQARGSRIITNAHEVNAGRLPVTDNAPGTDFWLFRTEDRERIADLVVDLVANRVRAKFGYGPDDIQVLCPMKKEADPIGATQLNRRLQAVVNPFGKCVATRGETQFRIGDRIMQTRNDYDKGVFNGDLGTIVANGDEDPDENVILVADFDGLAVPLTQADLANVELAYACTVHKSQGSEYPVVVIPLHESQWVMLKRNLLYTGITRARKQCILVGSQKAIAVACRNEDTRKRYTMLKERLLEPMTGEDRLI